MTKIEKLAQRLVKAKQAVGMLEEQYAALRLETIRKVTLTKNGSTWTLEYKGRKIKAKKNRYNRLDVWDGQTKAMILRDCLFGGVHDLRFALATGKI